MKLEIIIHLGFDLVITMTRAAYSMGLPESEVVSLQVFYLAQDIWDGHGAYSSLWQRYVDEWQHYTGIQFMMTGALLAWADRAQTDHQ